MKTKYIVLGCVLLLLVLSGCTSFSQGGSRIQSQDTIEDYRKGTSGVDLSYINGLPQKELLENSLFSVGVTVHNKGATDVVNGRIILTYDEDYLNFYTTTNTFFELEGKNQFNTQGEERAFFFEGETAFLDRESSSRDVTISSTICYEYESIYTSPVCLDRPYTNDREIGEKVCEMKDLRSSGQGGPVYVSSVQVSSIQNNVGVRPFFDIEVSHRNNGLVIHPDVYDNQCSRLSAKDSLNKIVIKSAKLSDVALDCNKRELSLIDNTAKFRCSTFAEIVPERLPFQAQLQLELAYGYSETKSAKVNIIR